MNDLDQPTFSSLRGSRARKPVLPQTRLYGKCRVAYTPLQTNLDPRTAYRNDVEHIDAQTLAVVLQDGALAIIDRCEYEHLREMGYLGRWTAKPVSGGNTYVAVNHGRSILTLARLLLAASKSESVRYRDGDTLNLTRANLVVCSRGGNPIRDPGPRRCLPAPHISAKERREVALRMGGRPPSVAAAAAAARAARDKASPSIAAARATRRLPPKSLPSRAATGSWGRQLIAKPTSTRERQA